VEATIVEATIVVRSVLPLPEHITRHAADTILTDRATNRPLVLSRRRTDRRDAGLSNEKRGTDKSPAPSAVIPSVAANAPAAAIYELPHVGHERLLLVWRQ
jgi:hypothetical protein